MKQDITQTSNTDLASDLTKYTNPTSDLNSPTDDVETSYDNENFTIYHGYYENDRFPEYGRAVNKFGTWITGNGWVADSSNDQVLLENISGNGKENLTSVLWNGEVTMNYNGDSYAQIIRNSKGFLINLKPLNAGRVRVIYKKGIINRYEFMSSDGKQVEKKLGVNEVFHRTNDRLGDSMNGQSSAKPLMWSLDTMSESLNDIRRIMHRSTIRVIYVPEDDRTRLANLKRDYAEAIQGGEVLVLPGNKKDYEFLDLQIPPITIYLDFLKYLEGKIYRAVGLPRTIAGDTDATNESGGKMEMVTFEPEYMRRVKDLEDDFWNQIGIKIKMNPQPSITQGVSDNAAKSVNQTQLAQPQDTEVAQ